MTIFKALLLASLLSIFCLPASAFENCPDTSDNFKKGDFREANYWIIPAMPSYRKINAAKTLANLLANSLTGTQPRFTCKIDKNRIDGLIKPLICRSFKGDTFPGLHELGFGRRFIPDKNGSLITVSFESSPPYNNRSSTVSCKQKIKIEYALLGIDQRSSKPWPEEEDFTIYLPFVALEQEIYDLDVQPRRQTPSL